MCTRKGRVQGWEITVLRWRQTINLTISPHSRRIPIVQYGGVLWTVAFVLIWYSWGGASATFLEQGSPHQPLFAGNDHASYGFRTSEQLIVLTSWPCNSATYDINSIRRHPLHTFDVPLRWHAYVGGSESRGNAGGSDSRRQRKSQVEFLFSRVCWCW
jgi:hypothetical protein